MSKKPKLDTAERMDALAAQAAKLIGAEGPTAADQVMKAGAAKEARRSHKLLRKIQALMQRLDKKALFLSSNTTSMIMDGKIQALPQGDDGFALVDKQSKIGIRVKPDGRVKITNLAQVDLNDIQALAQRLSSVDMLSDKPVIEEPKGEVRWVVSHKEFGVYLGMDQGERVWSKLTDQKWLSAKTFKSADDARTFLDSIFPKIAEGDREIHEVDADATSGLVSVAAMLKAGLKARIGDRIC